MSLIPVLGVDIIFHNPNLDNVVTGWCGAIQA